MVEQKVDWTVCDAGTSRFVWIEEFASMNQLERILITLVRNIFASRVSNNFSIGKSLRAKSFLSYVQF